jgi:homoserine O-acetyltransferase
MDKAIPIVGSPRPTSYDLILYSSGLKMLKEAAANEQARAALVRGFADFFLLTLDTPTYFVEHLKREDAVGYTAGFENAMLAWDPWDIVVDLDAVCTNDAFKDFGDSEAKAAAAVHAKVLVISASQDHCVNPAAALGFAKALGAETIVLDGDEGHSSPGPATPRIAPAIDKFLSEP